MPYASLARQIGINAALIKRGAKLLRKAHASTLTGDAESSRLLFVYLEGVADEQISAEMLLLEARFDGLPKKAKIKALVRADPLYKKMVRGAKGTFAEGELTTVFGVYAAVSEKGGVLVPIDASVIKPGAMKKKLRQLPNDQIRRLVKGAAVLKWSALKRVLSGKEDPEQLLSEALDLDDLTGAERAEALHLIEEMKKWLQRDQKSLVALMGALDAAAADRDAEGRSTLLPREEDGVPAEWLSASDPKERARQEGLDALEDALLFFDAAWAELDEGWPAYVALVPDTPDLLASHAAQKAAVDAIRVQLLEFSPEQLRDHAEQVRGFTLALATSVTTVATAVERHRAAEKLLERLEHWGARIESATQRIVQARDELSATRDEIAPGAEESLRALVSTAERLGLEGSGLREVCERARDQEAAALQDPWIPMTEALKQAHRVNGDRLAAFAAAESDFLAKHAEIVALGAALGPDLHAVQARIDQATEWLTQAEARLVVSGSVLKEGLEHEAQAQRCTLSTVVTRLRRELDDVEATLVRDEAETQAAEHHARDAGLLVSAGRFQQAHEAARLQIVRVPVLRDRLDYAARVARQIESAWHVETAARRATDTLEALHEEVEAVVAGATAATIPEDLQVLREQLASASPFTQDLTIAVAEEAKRTLVGDPVGPALLEAYLGRLARYEARVAEAMAWLAVAREGAPSLASTVLGLIAAAAADLAHKHQEVEAQPRSGAPEERRELLERLDELQAAAALSTGRVEAAMEACRAVPGWLDDPVSEEAEPAYCSYRDAHEAFVAAVSAQRRFLVEALLLNEARFRIDRARGVVSGAQEAVSSARSVAVRPLRIDLPGLIASLDDRANEVRDEKTFLEGLLADRSEELSQWALREALESSGWDWAQAIAQFEADLAALLEVLAELAEAFPREACTAQFRHTTRMLADFADELEEWTDDLVRARGLRSPLDGVEIEDLSDGQKEVLWDYETKFVLDRRRDMAEAEQVVEPLWAEVTERILADGVLHAGLDGRVEEHLDNEDRFAELCVEMQQFRALLVDLEVDNLKSESLVDPDALLLSQIKRVLEGVLIEAQNAAMFVATLEENEQEAIKDYVTRADHLLVVFESGAYASLERSVTEAEGVCDNLRDHLREPAPQLITDDEWDQNQESWQLESKALEGADSYARFNRALEAFQVARAIFNRDTSEQLPERQTGAESLAAAINELKQALRLLITSYRKEPGLAEGLTAFLQAIERSGGVIDHYFRQRSHLDRACQLVSRHLTVAQAAFDRVMLIQDAGQSKRARDAQQRVNAEALSRCVMVLRSSMSVVARLQNEGKEGQRLIAAILGPITPPNRAKLDSQDDRHDVKGGMTDALDQVRSAPWLRLDPPSSRPAPSVDGSVGIANDPLDSALGMTRLLGYFRQPNWPEDRTAEVGAVQTRMLALHKIPNADPHWDEVAREIVDGIIELEQPIRIIRTKTAQDPVIASFMKRLKGAVARIRRKDPDLAREVPLNFG